MCAPAVEPFYREPSRLRDLEGAAMQTGLAFDGAVHRHQRIHAFLADAGSFASGSKSIATREKVRSAFLSWPVSPRQSDSSKVVGSLMAYF